MMFMSKSTTTGINWSYPPGGGDSHRKAPANSDQPMSTEKYVSLSGFHHLLPWYIYAPTRNRISCTLQISRGFIEGPAGVKDATCMRRSVAQSEERRSAPRFRFRTVAFTEPNGAGTCFACVVGKGVIPVLILPYIHYLCRCSTPVPTLPLKNFTGQKKKLTDGLHSNVSNTPNKRSVGQRFVLNTCHIVTISLGEHK